MVDASLRVEVQVRGSGRAKWGARPMGPTPQRSSDLATRLAIRWCREHGHNPVIGLVEWNNKHPDTAKANRQAHRRREQA